MRESIADILTAFALSFAFCGALIPFLRRKKAGQAILSYVKEHACKSGTPTMGGLAFIPAACLAALLLCEKTRQLSVALSGGNINKREHLANFYREAVGHAAAADANECMEVPREWGGEYLRARA